MRPGGADPGFGDALRGTSVGLRRPRRDLAMPNGSGARWPAITDCERIEWYAARAGRAACSTGAALRNAAPVRTSTPQRAQHLDSVELCRLRRRLSDSASRSAATQRLRPARHDRPSGMERRLYRRLTPHADRGGRNGGAGLQALVGTRRGWMTARPPGVSSAGAPERRPVVYSATHRARPGSRER